VQAKARSHNRQFIFSISFPLTINGTQYPKVKRVGKKQENERREVERDFIDEWVE
jgi:hypothetical protein